MACTTTCVSPSPSQAHCGADGCHVTFGGVGGFDAHRRGGKCRTPAEVGYVDNGRGVFRAPISEAERAGMLRRVRPSDTDAPSGVRSEP